MPELWGIFFQTHITVDNFDCITILFFHPRGDQINNTIVPLDRRLEILHHCNALPKYGHLEQVIRQNIHRI